MKKIHIFGIIVIAIAIAMLVATGSDASTYVDFSAAKQMNLDGNKGKVHVVGKLKKDTNGQIIGMSYHPEIDANLFQFLLVDNAGIEKTVVYNAPKPQDLEKSEQIVVIGAMEGENFHCDKILLKCPSKYQDGKVDFKTQQ